MAVEVFLSCGRCAACAVGQYRRCARHGLVDMHGFTAVDVGSGLWGGYATHVELRPDTLLLPVPDGVDPVLATAFNPLGAGIRWAATLPQTGPADVVAVLGPGIRGLFAAAAAKRAGAEFVLVTGRGDRDHDRLRWAERFGADLTVDVARDDPVEALRSATGRSADVVIDVTAKAPEAPTTAFDLVRTGGTVVLAGTRGRDRASVDPDAIVMKEIRVLGALGVDADAYRDALDVLRTDLLPAAELPRRTVGLDEAPGLLGILAGRTGRRGSGPCGDRALTRRLPPAVPAGAQIPGLLSIVSSAPREGDPAVPTRIDGARRALDPRVGFVLAPHRRDDQVTAGGSVPLSACVHHDSTVSGDVNTLCGPRSIGSQ